MRVNYTDNNANPQYEMKPSAVSFQLSAVSFQPLEVVFSRMFRLMAES
jgi:hypothetical protein